MLSVFFLFMIHTTCKQFSHLIFCPFPRTPLLDVFILLYRYFLPFSFSYFPFFIYMFSQSLLPPLELFPYFLHLISFNVKYNVNSYFAWRLHCENAQIRSENTARIVLQKQQNINTFLDTHSQLTFTELKVVFRLFPKKSFHNFNLYGFPHLIPLIYLNSTLKTNTDKLYQNTLTYVYWLTFIKIYGTVVIFNQTCIP